MVDFDSFSPFWILVDKQLKVRALSTYFKHISVENQRLYDLFEILQPRHKEQEYSFESFQNKIVIFKHNSIKFRATLHWVNDVYLIIAWPIFSSLDELKEKNFGIILSHPASLVTDHLMAKDVISKAKEKIHKLEMQATQNLLIEERQINAHKAKLASLGKIVAGVGHEINNPLAIATGNTKFLKKLINSKSLDLEKINKFIDKALYAHTRIETIVKSLKVYSRKKDIELQIINIVEVVSKVYQISHNIYEKEGVSIELEINEEGPILVEGNSGKIEQILLNLLRNAADAMENSEARKIKISVQNLGLGKVQISVSDTGSGIPKEFHEKIFEPFWTSKKIGKGTGLGLGLAVESLRQMGSKIFFSTKMEEGTTFCLQFPTVKGNENILRNLEQKDRSVKREKTIRILAVDDESDILDILETFFDDNHFSFQAFNTPNKALNHLKENANFDIVLSDMMMPEMNGDEFVKAAANYLGTTAKFYIITGGACEKLTKNEQLMRIITRIFPKPIPFQELLNDIKKIS